MTRKLRRELNKSFCRKKIYLFFSGYIEYNLPSVLLHVKSGLLDPPQLEEDQKTKYNSNSQ